MTQPPATKTQHKNSEIALAVVVLAAYVVYIGMGGYKDPPGEILRIGALGIVYLLTGIYGSRMLDKRKTTAGLSAFFFGEILLGILIVYYGKGATWMVLLPMVGSAVEYLPHQWTWPVCLIITIGIATPFYQLGGWSTLSSWLLPILAAVVFVAVFTQTAVSEQRARRELAHAHQQLREYAAKVEDLAVAQERNRLAREIHDGLGHYLTAINIQIKAAQATIQQDTGQAVEALNNAQTLAQEALADVRRSVSSLRTDPNSGQSLTEMIERLLQETRSSGLQATLQVQGDCRPLSHQVEFTLYRAAQEGLTNVRKHARATQVDARLEYTDHGVRLKLQDNGSGAEQASGGFGLVGLRERVQLAGGRLETITAPGEGFILQVEIPT